jgi:hypothetical protein
MRQLPCGLAAVLRCSGGPSVTGVVHDPIVPGRDRSANRGFPEAHDGWASVKPLSPGGHVEYCSGDVATRNEEMTDRDEEDRVTDQEQSAAERGEQVAGRVTGERCACGDRRVAAGGRDGAVADRVDEAGPDDQGNDCEDLVLDDGAEPDPERCPECVQPGSDVRPARATGSGPEHPQGHEHPSDAERSSDCPG